MSEDLYNVLFLSAGNSARSILAECLANRHGARRFRAFSAGCHPKGEIHPIVIELLREHDYQTGALRSKSWDEFRAPDAPSLDFVITICHLEPGDACPTWAGQPLTAHWGVEDPDELAGNPGQERRFFERVHAELESRVKLFTSLRGKMLDSMRLQPELHDIESGAQQPRQEG
jgi:arsenate reductase